MLCESLAPVARTFGVNVVVIEPGAVIGEFANRGAGVANRPDSPYSTMRIAYNTMMSGAYDGAPYPDEIARSIVAVALDPSPHPGCRYRSPPLGSSA